MQTRSDKAADVDEHDSAPDLDETMKRPSIILPSQAQSTFYQLAQKLRIDQWRGWLSRYHWLVATLLYTVITLCVTNGIIFHMNDAIIGEGSSFNGDNTWYVWWLDLYRTAINTGHDPAYTHLFYALTPKVQIFSISPVNGDIGYILQIFLSPLATYNLLILLHFVLSGVMAYMLAGEFVSSRAARFASGFLYAFTTYHFARNFGHLTLATLEWLPFCAWRMFVFFRRPTWANGIWAGVGVALVALTDAYYIAYFLLPFLILFFIGKLISDHRWFLQPRHLLYGAFGIIVALMLVLPPMGNYLHTDPTLQTALKHYSLSSVYFSGDLAAFFLPFWPNPVYGSLTAPIYHQMLQIVTVERGVFLGYIALTLSIGTLAFRQYRRSRTVAFWFITGIVGFILALGPVLQFLGPVLNQGHLINLPYYYIYNSSLLLSFRAPDRLVINVVLALSVLAAFTIQAVISRFGTSQRRHLMLYGAVVVVLALSLSEHIQPSGVAKVTIPQLYYQIGQDKSATLLLDLPVAANGNAHFYQLTHHKPLVGGYAARPTEPEMISVENLPYVSLFDYGAGQIATATAPQLALQADIYPLNATMVRGLQASGIGYVVLHDDQLVPALVPWTNAYLRVQLGTPFYDNPAEGLLAWRIPAGPPADPAVMHFSMGTGWNPGLYVNGTLLSRYVEQDAQLLIASPTTGAQHVRFLAQPYAAPATLSVSVNGTMLAQHVVLKNTATPQAVDLGMVPLHQGQNTITFHSSVDCSVQLDDTCINIALMQLQVTGA